jgi:hypothetical protein
MADQPFIFPKWTNSIRVVAALAGGGLGLYVAVMLAYGAVPETMDMRYMPEQPVPYSHALHVGKLGMDCRYCHNTVDEASHAAIPPTQTCLNCHHAIWNNSEKLTPVYESAATGRPIEWVRVHDLPDYSYFNHAAHVNRGVGCVECHGRVDKMEVVYQAAPLSMGWCLDCHRDPGPKLRPAEYITALDMTAAQARAAAGVSEQDLLEQYKIRPALYLQSCSVCHH